LLCFLIVHLTPELLSWLSSSSHSEPNVANAFSGRRGRKVSEHQRTASSRFLVLSFSVSTVEVETRRSEWNEGDPILLIHREFTPIVNTAGGCAQRFGRPGIRAELARLGNAVERPL
jgi:hypothetical protein